MNVTVVFTKSFTLREKGENLVLRIAGAQVYRISLNGNFAGYGPARAPKGFARVDEWNLSRYAKEGENVLAVEVASYRCFNYYLPNVPPFFMAELLLGGRILFASGTGIDATLSARTIRVPRFSYQRTFSESWKIGADDKEKLPLEVSDYGTGVKFLPRRVGYPFFGMAEAFRPKSLLSFGGLQGGESYGDTSECFWWRDSMYAPHCAYAKEELEEDTVCENLSIREKVVRRIEDGRGEPKSLSAGDGILYEGESNDTGFITLDIAVNKAPCRVAVRFDELLDERGLVRPDRYSCNAFVVWEFEKKGLFHVESFEPYTLKYASLFVVKGAASPISMSLRRYSCGDIAIDMPSFRDETANSVFKAAVSTFAQNAVDVFTDCPGRERAGWLCDSFWIARASRLLTGSLAHEELFLENYAVADKFDYIPEGMVPMCWPADHVSGQFIPNWALWLILEIEDYFCGRDGDRALVDALKDKVYGIIGFLRGFKNEYGLLENLPGWVFVEWSKANELTDGVNFPSNMLWAKALMAAYRLYGDETCKAESIDAARKILELSFDGEWFRDRAKRTKDGVLAPTPEKTETCQYYAIYSGIADSKREKVLFERLFSTSTPLENPGCGALYPANAFIGNYLRLEILSMTGRKSQVAREISELFGDMAKKTGTLWEHMTPSASCCHGFASYAACLLHDALIRNI